MGNNPSRANGHGSYSRSRSYSQDRGPGAYNLKRGFTTRGRRDKYDQEYVDEEDADADEYGRHRERERGAFAGQMSQMPQMQYSSHTMSTSSSCRSLSAECECPVS